MKKEERISEQIFAYNKIRGCLSRCLYFGEDRKETPMVVALRNRTIADVIDARKNGPADQNGRREIF